MSGVVVPGGKFADASHPAATIKWGISFPPVNIPQEKQLTTDSMSELAIHRLHFSTDWTNIEKQEDVYSFGGHSERIQWVKSNGYFFWNRIPSRAPIQYCDPAKTTTKGCVYLPSAHDDFKDFVEALLDHDYQTHGYIHPRITWGNEWQNDNWWPGTAQEYVTLNNIFYQTVKQKSPSTEVVLGAFINRAARNMAFCLGYVSYAQIDWGLYFYQSDCQKEPLKSYIADIVYVLENADYDALDVHLYHDSHDWKKIMIGFKEFLNIHGIDKPIYSSEFGGPNQLLLYSEPTEEFHAQKVTTYMNTLQTIPIIKEAYYFKLAGVEADPTTAYDKSRLIHLTGFTLPPSGSLADADLIAKKKKGFFSFKLLSNPSG